VPITRNKKTKETVLQDTTNMLPLEKMVAYDTETTGLSVYRGDSMFAYSTCDIQRAIAVKRLSERGASGMLDIFIAKAESHQIAPVMHNSKFDISFTEKQLGRHFAEKIEFHDTQIMSNMLRSDHHSHRLKDLAWELAGIPKDDEAEISAYLANKADENYSHVPPDIMRRYQERDAIRAMTLCAFFLPKIQANPKLYDCYLWERDVVVPTMRMEERGFMINRTRTEKIRADMLADAQAALNDVEAEYGARIDIGNDNVLRRVLYEERGLPILSTTATGKPSVDKKTLDELYQMSHDPLLRLAVRYKARRRGATTLESYLEAADESDTIHPSVNPLGAHATGRESCSNPNLQNVESKFKAANLFPTPARKCFRPRPDYVNFHVDYGQIEFRLLVHYSKDPELLAEVAKPDGDAHLKVAQIFYPPFDMYSDEDKEEFEEFWNEHPVIAAGIDAFPNKKSDEFKQLRNTAKNTNFAVPYGAGQQKCSATLGLPNAIGKKRFAEYQQRFPRLCNMTRDIIPIVKANGGVETTFGRMLRVPSSKAYAGVNFLIQGTAAQMLKRSQVRVHKYLEEATGGEAGIIIPIHDELVIEWPRKRLGEAKHCWRKIREIMIDFPQFDVPFEVEVEVATRDWYNKKEYTFMD